MKAKKPKETADLRFQKTLPLQKFRKLTIGIAGLGAIGRNVAILLAAMGHKKLCGADPDKIELKNVGTQGWNSQFVGRYKSQILRLQLTGENSKFMGFPCKFENFAKTQAPAVDIFFCCVDKMAARSAIWNVVNPVKPKEQQKARDRLWIDARMTPAVIRIITIPLAGQKARDYYLEGTLFSDNEAFAGACTDRMTMYGAYIAAGLMVSQMANWLNGLSLITDFILETKQMSSVILKR